MQKIFALLVVLFSVKLSAQNIFTSLDSALVACYPFTGNANDASGNALHGTVNSASLTADRFGNSNSAYSFAGYTNTMNISVTGLSSYLNGNGISICFWTLKTTSAYDLAFMMSPDNASNRLSVTPYYAGTDMYWDCGNISSSGRLNVSSSLTNSWDYWVCTSNSSAMKVYKNGALLSSQSGSSTFSTSPTRDLFIGGGVSSGGGSSWYNGTLDDIRIYKRALLGTEVAYLYANNVNCTPCPTVAIPTNTNPISSPCAGSTTTLFASGTASLQWYGTPSSTVSVQTGTVFTPTITASGNYSYYVRSRNGCNSSSPLALQFTITPTPTLQVVKSSSVVCAGQSLSLQASGASSFTWLPGNAQTSGISITPSANVTYTLLGLLNSCTTTTFVSIPVTLNPSVSIAGSSSVACGGSLSLVASGATNYTWLPGNAQTTTLNINPSSTTTYTLIGATNGCINHTTLNISVSSPPSISIAGSTSVVCGGSLSLIASGATSYTWLPGNGQTATLNVNPTSSTTYTLIGASSGCPSYTTLNVFVGPPPSVSITGSTSVACGGALSLIATGATNYTWLPGNGQTATLNANPTSNTTYTLIGATNGCASYTTLNVSVGPPPNLSIAGSTSVACGGSVSLIASGATNYTWLPGNGQTATLNANPTSNTTYTLIGVTNGCASYTTLNVSVGPPPNLSIAGSTSVACGGSVSLIASGATNYTWLPGNGQTATLNVSPSSNTTYTLIGATNGCASYTTLAISVSAPNNIFISGPTSVACGVPASLVASGATTYTWLPGSAQTTTLNINPSSNTTYTLIGATNGCLSYTTVNISVSSTPTLYIAGSSSLSCGAAVSLFASGATNYTWQPGNVIAANLTTTPSVTTIYSVTGESGGCMSTATIGVQVGNIPTITVSGSSVICLGNTAQLLAGGANNYTWSPGNIYSQLLNVTPSVNVSYILTGESGGCTTTMTINLSVVNPPVVSIAASSTSLCPGSSATLTASGGASYYNWTGLIGNAIVVVSPSQASTYTVTGVDAFNCSSTANISIGLNIVSPISISNSSGVICAGETVSLSAVGGTNYTWNTGAQGNLISVSPVVTSTYMVIGNDLSNGCQTSASYIQQVNACTGLTEETNSQILLQIYPNPTNGRFECKTGSEGFITIHNLVGEIVYKAWMKDNLEINLEGLSSGIYTLLFENNHKVITTKLVKQ